MVHLPAASGGLAVIPDFQTLMHPILAAHDDGAEHMRAPLRRQMADHFELTEGELEEMLPSGRQRRFDNRVAWAVSYMVHAGLLERPRRGVTCITERGREVLAANPARVDIGVLEQFEEFRQFRSGSEDDGEQSDKRPQATSGEETPEEVIETAFTVLTDALATELRDKLAETSPERFEEVVIDVLTAMGYGGSRREAGERLGRSGDAGIDGVIREDALGLGAIYLQAKRWADNRPVGRPDVQAFVGALQGEKASKGVFITTSRCSAEAQQYADSVTPRVVLIDGRRLAHLMIGHGVGVTTRQRYEVKRVDEDYFLEDA